MRPSLRPGPPVPEPCGHCRSVLGATLLGQASPAEAAAVAAHLATCPACTREAAELQAVLDGLLRVPEPLPPPPALRERLLASARHPASSTPASGQPDLGQPDPIRAGRSRPRRSGALARRAPPAPRWLSAVGVVAALGLLTGLVWPLLTGRPSPPAQLSAARADVVIRAGERVVVVGSHGAPLSIREPGGRLRRVALSEPQPAWYTEGVYREGRAYLLDAANARLVVLNVDRGQVERTLPTPGGAAGLAVTAQGVFVKTSASGELLVFGGAGGPGVYRRVLARAAPLPQAELMDAVLPVTTPSGPQVWTTQHTSGEVFALSADGRRLLATYRLGGAPVGLGTWAGRVLVLDVSGRLLELDTAGRVRRTLTLGGAPDKLSVQGDRAYLTDRGGRVCVIDLTTFRLVRQRTFGQPMDIVALPGGHLALADAVGGLIMLTDDLGDA